MNPADPRFNPQIGDLKEQVRGYSFELTAFDGDLLVYKRAGSTSRSSKEVRMTRPELEHSGFSAANNEEGY